MNYVSASGELHEVTVENFHTFPSQPARIPSPRSMQSCDKRLPPDTWHLSGLQENVFFFYESTFDARVIENTSSRNSSICGTKCCWCGSRACQRRDTCGKRGRKNRKHNSNADICKKAADDELLYSCGYSTGFYGWAAKTSRHRNFNLTNSLLSNHFYVGR